MKNIFSGLYRKGYSNSGIAFALEIKVSEIKLIKISRLKHKPKNIRELERKQVGA